MSLSKTRFSMVINTNRLSFVSVASDLLRAKYKAEHNYAALQALPRNASPVRAHSRDELDGRPHAYMRKFKMSRLNFRDLAHKGQIPGVRKASW